MRGADCDTFATCCTQKLGHSFEWPTENVSHFRVWRALSGHVFSHVDFFLLPGHPWGGALVTKHGVGFRRDDTRWRERLAEVVAFREQNGFLPSQTPQAPVSERRLSYWLSSQRSG